MNLVDRPTKAKVSNVRHFFVITSYIFRNWLIESILFINKKIQVTDLKLV